MCENIEKSAKNGEKVVGLILVKNEVDNVYF